MQDGRMPDAKMDVPFDGLLRVYANPLRYAYAHLNQ